MSQLKALAAAAALTLAVGAAQAAAIQSAASTLGGPAIDFEGFAEGTRIDSQYPGITFGQTDGGRPMIDNLPFLFAYAAQSGIGVLTGSQDGGAPFVTVAELSMTLTGGGSALEFWLSDTAPLGVYTINAFDAANNLLETAVVRPNQFVGFTGLAGLSRVTVDSSNDGDAFAIDDVRFINRVPEPTALALVGLALVGVAGARRRRSA